MTDVAVRRLESLLRTHRNQQSLLFVGAGFSAEAERQGLAAESLPIPAGRDLVKIMQEALAEDSDDLGALSDLYETQFGEHGLYELLSKLFVARSVTPTQRTIASFDWKQIYTTNFDNVLQLCLASDGKRFSTYTMSSRPSEVDYRTLPIIHINGFVYGTSFANFRKDIRLTNTQYYSDDFSRSPWGERFRSDLTTSPCIIFAGYSMYDLDVARILRSFEGMEDRIFFVVQNKPSRASEKKLEQFGQVLAIGTDGLSAVLSNIQKGGNAPTSPYFSAWERLESPAGGQRALRDIDVTNFLMSGSINEANFASDVIGKFYKIAINRTASDQITQRVDASQLAHVMIVSNIGNGKSTLLDSVAYKLLARGHIVYRSGPHTSGLLREVALFRQISGPLFLIIDDAFNNIDVVKAVLAFGREDMHIITSARTSEFELREGEVKATFDHKVDVFSIDALDDKEVADLIQFMDNYALWGERQSLRGEQKAKYLKTDCSRELRAVILDVLNSPNIRSRIERLLHFQDDPNTEDRVRSILIISQLLNLAQIQPDLWLVGEILHTDAGVVIKAHEKQLRDFSLVRNGRISLRSPIFSEFILQKFIDTSYVIDSMSKSMRTLDVIFDNDEIYRDVFKSFSRFRFIETAIAPEKRLVHMVKYYENIKELYHCRSNSLFWLQYAMCRLSLSQYREAHRLFDVAYSFSKQAGYRENRHLNNQYARFLLESRTKTDEYTDYMAAFNEAHGICVKQMNDEPLSYNPYRVATNYAGFLERRASQLNVGDLVSVFRSCAEVQKFIGRRKKEGNISNYRVVEDCARAMNSAIALAKSKLAEHGVQM